MKKIVGILTLILLTLGIVYYGLEVYKARKTTLDMVNIFLSSDAYRLKISDFTNERVEQLLKVEDPSFYTHKGVDLLTKGNGMNTISQKLVKKLFEIERDKIKEVLIAKFAVDPIISKDLQFEMYVNIMPLGREIYGLEDASQYYYKKDFTKLNKEEYIALVGILIDPNKYNLEDFPIRNNDRYERVKKYLEGNYIPKGVFDIYYDRE